MHRCGSSYCHYQPTRIQHLGYAGLADPITGRTDSSFQLTRLSSLPSSSPDSYRPLGATNCLVTPSSPRISILKESSLSEIAGLVYSSSTTLRLLSLSTAPLSRFFLAWPRQTRTPVLSAGIDHVDPSHHHQDIPVAFARVQPAPSERDDAPSFSNLDFRQPLSESHESTFADLHLTTSAIADHHHGCYRLGGQGSGQGELDWH